MAQKFRVKNHSLVPKHVKLSEKDKKELLEKYKITIKHLPSILLTDPGIEELTVKENDIIKIERDSPTAGKTVFYRRVTHA